MVGAALQTDASMLESKGFEAEQTEIPQDKQGETVLVNTEYCPPRQPDSKCNTIRWEPSWTREYLHDQQREDTSLKVIIQFKKASAVRPKWEDVSPYARTVKTLGLMGPAGAP